LAPLGLPLGLPTAPLIKRPLRSRVIFSGLHWQPHSNELCLEYSKAAIVKSEL
jgi:hypothetical protein